MAEGGHGRVKDGAWGSGGGAYGRKGYSARAKQRGLGQRNRARAVLGLEDNV